MLLEIEDNCLLSYSKTSKNLQKHMNDMAVAVVTVYGDLSEKFHQRMLKLADIIQDTLKKRKEQSTKTMNEQTLP